MFVGFIILGIESSHGFECPPTGIHTLAYPWSCRRFVRCIAGNALIQECAPGLYFDAVLGQCNVFEIANCNPCQEKEASELVFVRDERNCSRFSICIGQVLSENTCAQGLYFDPRVNSCARSENVECPSSDGGGTTTTTQPPVGPPGPQPPAPPSDDPIGPGSDGTCDIDLNFEIIASPVSCQQHTICTCGHPNIRTCPSGLIFDVTTQQCNTREQGHCLSESVPQCPPNTVDIYAHPYDCRYLVICILGNPTLEPCAAGLEVNRRTNKCDFRHVAQCSSQNPLTYSQLMSGMAFL